MTRMTTPIMVENECNAEARGRMRKRFRTEQWKETYLQLCTSAEHDADTASSAIAPEPLIAVRSRLKMKSTGEKPPAN